MAASRIRQPAHAVGDVAVPRRAGRPQEGGARTLSHDEHQDRRPHRTRGPEATSGASPRGPTSEATVPSGGPTRLPPATCWAAVHTHPRAEKAVAAHLAQRGIPHYLPLRRNRRTYGARRRESWVPLFPGYLFYDHAAAPERTVYAARRIVRIIASPTPEALRESLRAIARLLAEDPDLRATDLGPPGSPVEVTCGPLAGLRGEWVRRAGQSRLMVRIPYLALATEISIDVEWLRPLPPEGAAH